MRLFRSTHEALRLHWKKRGPLGTIILYLTLSDGLWTPWRGVNMFVCDTTSYFMTMKANGTYLCEHHHIHDGAGARAGDLTGE